jgi:hypothetical protein
LQKIDEGRKGKQEADNQQSEGNEIDRFQRDRLRHPRSASTNHATSQTTIASVVTPDNVPVGL